MKFARENKKATTFIALAIFFLMAMVNVLYFIFVPIDAQGDPERFVATPIIEHSSVAGPTSDNSEVISSTTLIILMILLGVVLLIITILFALLMHAASQRRKRDRQRKADLKLLAQALEAYRLVHGHYPLSSTFQPEYYTGINLSNDWNYYGLPDKEHMSKFIPDWPISDPSLDYMAKNQTNQYIYYPKENGQKFYLYAHLESPTRNEQIDYNSQDNLLRSWGSYNYRVESGQEQPLEVNDIHQYIPHSTSRPTATPETNQVSQPPTNPAPPATTPTENTSQASTSDTPAMPPTQSIPEPIQHNPDQSAEAEVEQSGAVKYVPTPAPIEQPQTTEPAQTQYENNEAAQPEAPAPAPAQPVAQTPTQPIVPLAQPTQPTPPAYQQPQEQPDPTNPTPNDPTAS